MIKKLGHHLSSFLKKNLTSNCLESIHFSTFSSIMPKNRLEIQSKQEICDFKAMQLFLPQSVL